jgi:transcriptional regulator with XRE-family HTH domain
LDGVVLSGEDLPNVSQPATETIGQRLRRLRSERGLSQRDLAVPGVSYAYISRIEAGTRQPSVKALRKLAGKLGVSPEYLETGSEIRDSDRRELELSDAELQLRLNNDPESVEERLTKIYGEAVAAGDITAADRAKLALAYAASLQERYDVTIAHLEELIAAGRASASTRPDVYVLLGRMHALKGDSASAVELFEDALQQLEDENPDDIPARTRFATYLSYALTDLGALEKAEEVVQTALTDASDLADPITQVRLNWSMARLAAMQDRPTAALGHARKALALYEVTEDSLGIARAHVLCAYILNGKGSLEAAGKHLESAERLFGVRADRPDLAYLRTEQARLAAARGDHAIAVAYARESLELLDESDPAERGLAYVALGQGLAAGGDAEGARRELERGFELLVEHGRWRDARRCAETLAHALRSLGRNADADAVLERAGALGEASTVTR